MSPEVRERLRAIQRERRAKVRKLKDVPADELLVECDRLEEDGLNWSEGADHCMIYVTLKWATWGQLEALRGRLPHRYGVFFRHADRRHAGNYAVVKPVFHAPDLDRLVGRLNLDGGTWRYVGGGNSLLSCVRTWRTYRGYRTVRPVVEVTEPGWEEIARSRGRDPVPPVLDPEPSQRLRNHSPSGFNWGYGGGPSLQLALALLLDCTGNDYLAVRNYERYHDAVAPGWGDAWEETGSHIAGWLWDREKGGG